MTAFIAKRPGVAYSCSHVLLLTAKASAIMESRRQAMDIEPPPAKVTRGGSLLDSILGSFDSDNKEVEIIQQAESVRKAYLAEKPIVMSKWWAINADRFPELAVLARRFLLCLQLPLWLRECFQLQDWWWTKNEHKCLPRWLMHWCSSTEIRLFSTNQNFSQALWEITGISYGNKSRLDAHSNQMGHTLPIRDSWP